MRVLLSLLLLLTAPAVWPAGDFERETFYSNQHCAAWGGAPTALPSGIRPDCETRFAVVEFDWAKRPKVYECIGQAIAYAEETGKTPVCAMLARTPDELDYAERMEGTVKRAGVVPVIIILYPAR